MDKLMSAACLVYRSYYYEPLIVLLTPFQYDMSLITIIRLV